MSPLSTSHQPAHTKRYKANDPDSPLSVQVSIFASVRNSTRRTTLNLGRWIRRNAVVVVADTAYAALFSTAKQSQERRVREIEEVLASVGFPLEESHEFALMFDGLVRDAERSLLSRRGIGAVFADISWAFKLSCYKTGVWAFGVLYLYRVGIWRAQWWALMVLYFFFKIQDVMDHYWRLFVRT